MNFHKNTRKTKVKDFNSNTKQVHNYIEQSQMDSFMIRMVVNRLYS